MGIFSEFTVWCLLFALSCRYFSALSKGECLPVKDRMEMNIGNQMADAGLTPGLLKVLHKQVFYSKSTHVVTHNILLKKKIKKFT